MTDCCNGNHPHHGEELTRLNRMAGQIEGIKKMIDTQRYCPDIITQLRAVSSAAKAVEAKILRRHLEACVQDAFASKNAEEIAKKMDELVDLFKKL